MKEYSDEFNNNECVELYQPEFETKRIEKGMARLVPTRIPICNIIPSNTPAYFLYFLGQF